ncbi:nuclear transport factor 2 family protein [Streptomyces sp. NPDC005708]|uniref:nuclear transport factor 2 family protein n=1 Tax=Streptomyces sp. NPDC005708 TaxID=3154564 RepID=UPI0033C71D67
MNADTASTRPVDLPAVITRYLDAHQSHDTATALSTFTADAVVTDDGRTYEGTSAIESWLSPSSSEYTYTVTLTGAEHVDATHWTAGNHLEGDFPGDVVDLAYWFTLQDGLIEGLVIEP